MERFQHNISSRLSRINNRLLVSIDKLDNSKIIGLIESKHKLLKSPKELHNLFKKLLGFTLAKKALAKNTEGALKLVQSMPVRIEGYENIEHELLVAAQNKNRDRAISLYREYVNKEGSIVRYYKYANIVAKRVKKNS